MFIEYDSTKRCDCCKVHLPSYEAYSFDLLDEEGRVIKTLVGHKECIKYEAAQYPILSR